MAINAPDYVVITFRLRDQSATTTTRLLLGRGAVGDALPNLADPAVVAYLNEMASSIANLSDCHLLGWNATYSWKNDATLAYGDSPDRERKAVLQHFVPVSGKDVIFTIPGPKYALWDATGLHIPYDGTADSPTFTGTLATHIQSVHDKLRNGATSGAENYPVVDTNGDDVGALLEYYKQHRASSRG